MNSILTSNVAILAFAVGTMTSAVEQVSKNNFIAAGILVVISVLAFIGYEKLPTTPPTQQ